MAKQFNLRKFRTDSLRISQADLAAKLGVDQSTVSAWEKDGLPKRPLLREAIDAKLAELLAQTEQAA